MFPNLLTLKDTATELNIEPDTLRKWVQRKLIPHYRFPKKTSRPQFKPEDVIKFIEEHRIEAKPMRYR